MLREMRNDYKWVSFRAVTWPQIKCNDYTTQEKKSKYIETMPFKYVIHIMGLDDINRTNSA